MNFNAISILITAVIYFFAAVSSRSINKRESGLNIEIQGQGCCRDWWYSNSDRCIGSKCTPIVCGQISSCGPNTKCSTFYNIRICECLSGFKRDPYSKTGCVKSNSEPRCHSDWDCEDNEKCIGGKCSIECNKESLCGKNTKCFIANNNCACECLPGHNGNPYGSGCTKQSYVSEHKDTYCYNDWDCKNDENCISGKCSSECNKKSLCGDNTKCFIANHTCGCECLPGYNGNPYGSGCVKQNFGLFCDDDNQCTNDKACIKGRCTPVCNKCGPQRICTAKNHVGICKTIVPGCNNNRQCGNEKICIRGKCTLSLCNRCGNNTKCDSSINPHGICKCLPGYTGNPHRQGCEVSRKSCNNSNNCKDDEACIDNKCINLCSQKNSCGPNTICSATRHDHTCKCATMYEGDPYSFQGCWIYNDN